jgi:hypothetical protein
MKHELCEIHGTYETTGEKSLRISVFSKIALVVFNETWDKLY